MPSLPCHPDLAAPARLLLADGVDRTAVGERPEEAAQGPASRVDALRVLPQGHEHLLGDVLGGLPVDERPHGEPVDEAGVAVVQLDEGSLVAAGQALDQHPLRPRGLMPFVHEASPLHSRCSKPGAGADHSTCAGGGPGTRGPGGATISPAGRIRGSGHAGAAPHDAYVGVVRATACR